MGIASAVQWAKLAAETLPLNFIDASADLRPRTGASPPFRMTAKGAGSLLALCHTLKVPWHFLRRPLIG